MVQALQDWLDTYLGKLLLALAVAWSGYYFYCNMPQELPQELVKYNPERPVNVELNTAALKAASTERFYVKPGDYTGQARYVFAPEKVLKQYNAVDLGIPTIGVARPARLLPEPGPGLEGSAKLPRFGNEFPPLEIADPEAVKNANAPKVGWGALTRSGTPANTATTVNGPTTTKPNTALPVINPPGVQGNKLDTR